MDLSLDHLIAAVDADLGELPGTVVVRVDDDGEIAYRPLLDESVAEFLHDAGVAPPHCQVLGVHSTTARLHQLDPDHLGAPFDGERAIVTILFNRAGESAGVARTRTGVSKLAEVPAGVLSDAFRYALGLPPEQG